MKVAIVGSRGIDNVDLSYHVKEGDEMVSGGASGVDSVAEEYAEKKRIKMTVFLPEYRLYGRAAPIVRNKKIVDYADKVIAFWDGSSKGTKSVIDYAKKTGKPCEVIICKP